MGLVSTRLGLGLQINLYYQWRFYVGARGAIAPPVIAPPVFGFAPPVLHDATKNVAMNTVIGLVLRWCPSKRLRIRNALVL